MRLAAAASPEGPPAGGFRRLRRMTTVIALSYAWKVTIALVALFGIVFPALVTGLIAFAAAQMVAERKHNLERRHGHSR
jgi:hypothetical protein